MDINVFKSHFTKSEPTEYPCPSCSAGQLNVVKNSLIEKQTKQSSEMRHHPGYDSDDYESVYSVILECSNTNCKDAVSSSGSGWMKQHYSHDEEGYSSEYVTYFKPIFFYPHLNIFPIPQDTPAKAREEIGKSFSLLFADPPSSANHLRIAVEHLLDYLEIKKNSKNGFLPLGERIKMIPENYKGIKKMFLALKWLGNAGSHSTQGITFEDVFDGYKLMVEILDEIFSKKRESANLLAEKINQQKGPE